MRVLVTTQPADGHFNPLVPLARALEAAGHEVLVATAASYAPRVSGAGLAHAPVGTDLPPPPPDGRWGGVPVLEDKFRGAGELFGDQALAALPALERVLADWRPDAILREITELAGWVVAEAHRIPTVVVGVGVDPPPELVAMLFGSRVPDVRRAAGLTGEADWDTFFGEVHVEPAPPEWRATPGAPGMVFDAEPEHRSQTLSVRPSIFDTAGPEGLPDWVADLPDAPTVYVTMGTMANNVRGIYEALVGGLAGQDCNVVVSVGRDRDPATLSQAGGNIHVVGYVPASLLLPHCDAVVSHGGYGTTMAVLTHGLPHVVVPLSAPDQWVNATRTQALGAGVALSREQLTPERIRAAVADVLGDPSYRSAARRLATLIAALPGPEAVVAAIEAL